MNRKRGKSSNALYRAIIPYRDEFAAWTLLVALILTLLGLLNLADNGAIPVTLGDIARALFGFGAIPMILAFTAITVAQLLFQTKEEPSSLPVETIIGIAMFFIAGLGIAHIAAPNHGGYIGWGLAALMTELVGERVAGFILVILAVAGLCIAGSKIIPVKPPLPVKVALPQKPAPQTPVQPGNGLPAIDLLDSPLPETQQQANHKIRAKIIEDTLSAFNVSGKVTEINAGPTVTQYGIQPGVVARRSTTGEVVEGRIRVSKISALVDDLALALAASSIRIEAPVPGRPIVGIEVPNDSISPVSLRGGMESDAYRKHKGHLKVTLGKGVGGAVAVIDLAAQPHLLVAGATGSGKSVCINTIVVSLLMSYPPETLKLLMIDPKMVELTAYNGIPHLVTPVVTDFEQVPGALAWVTREMERRYKTFAAIGVKNIAGYNKAVEEAEKIPFMVVIIDELADLMMLAADEVERYICRIAQMARATGIHMIIATQRPSTDVVTGLIKANFPARIAFAVSSQIDSRVILDTPGADKLLGKGDMLYMAPDSPKLARLQGCFVSDAEIRRVVKFWQGYAAPAATEELPWAGGEPEKPAKDDVLERAVKLVAENGKASTSFLQRKLGIGYPRAARLMDQLETMGLIGPADGNNSRQATPKSGTVA